MSEHSIDIPPAWVQQASRSYVERPISPNDRTTMKRAFESADILEQAVKRMNVASMAVIGIGFENERLMQCVVPQILTARMANLGRNNFRMTLIDINPNADVIVGKKTIYAIPLTPEQESWWQHYLHETQQQDRPVSQHEKELVFISEKDLQFLKEEKVRAAETPMIYQSKLKNGDISVIHADVAQGGWAENNSLDYIDCRSVLMHLPKEGQQLSLWHMSRSLRPEGFLVLNDRSPGSPNVLLNENGGWLGDTALKELDLTDVTRTFQLSDESTIHIVQKEEIPNPDVPS
jgi:hypothetical protein